MGVIFGLMPTISSFSRVRVSGDVNARVLVLRSIVVSLACLALALALHGCDAGPSASERYDVNYLDELMGIPKSNIARILLRLPEVAGNALVQTGLILLCGN